MKKETTFSYWLVLLGGGGFAFIVTDMFADRVLPGEGRLAAAILHVSLFLPIFWVVNQLALRLRRGGDQ